MKDAVLFDLGGTLVGYYEKAQFAGILEQAITQVAQLSRGRPSCELPTR